jgi:hypothetical protein
VVIFSLFVQAPLARVAWRRNSLVGSEQDA